MHPSRPADGAVLRVDPVASAGAQDTREAEGSLTGSSRWCIRLQAACEGAKTRPIRPSWRANGRPVSRPAEVGFGEKGVLIWFSWHRPCCAAPAPMAGGFNYGSYRLTRWVGRTTE